MTRETVPKEVPDLVRDDIETLRVLFPQAFSEGKIDFEKLRLILGDNVEICPEKFTFSWAGKRSAIQILQMPTRSTLIPVKNESVNFDLSKNLFIEGDNLEVLKLLYKSYFGKIKMIYIDPPFNTGNDFIYPDNYVDPLSTYLKVTGQADKGGNLLTSNPETSGRFHSMWLSMMYPRLFLARQLLKDDGMIFVSIDDNEVNNLRLLMNEIFGEESFLACFIWHRRKMPDSRNLTRASTDHEYVVCYANPKGILAGRQIDVKKYSNPDNDPRGAWFSADLTGLATKEQRPNLHYSVTNPKTELVYHPPPTRGWAVQPSTFQKYVDEDLIIWPAKAGGRPRLKKFLSDVKNFKTGFSSVLHVGFTEEGTREIQELFGQKLIQFPKPVGMIKTLIDQVTSGDDIILDFFAGACPTAQAVLELNNEDGGNRRFIIVQLQEPLQSAKTINGTVLRTIADIGKERIRRVISKMKKNETGKLDSRHSRKTEHLGFKVFRLTESNFKPWKGLEEKTPENYAIEMRVHIDPFVDSWKKENVIYEVAIKEGFGLTSKIELDGKYDQNEVCRVTDEENEKHFLICLDDKIKHLTIRNLEIGKNDMFVCRDAALDDTGASNLALQCKLKTI